MASIIQETTFITVPRLAIGVVCRLNRACVALLAMFKVEFEIEETESVESRQAE
jgi:hypothetical protein